MTNLNLSTNTGPAQKDQNQNVTIQPIASHRNEMKKLFPANQVEEATHVYKKLVDEDTRYDLTHSKRTELLPIVEEYKPANITARDENERIQALNSEKQKFTKFKNKRLYLTVLSNEDESTKIQLLYRILRQWKHNVKASEAKNQKDYQQANLYSLNNKLQLEQLAEVIKKALPDISIKFDDNNSSMTIYGKDDQALVSIGIAKENTARFKPVTNDTKENVLQKQVGSYQKNKDIFDRNINFDEYVYDADSVITPRYIVRALTSQERTVLATYSIQAGLLPQGMTDKLTNLEKKELPYLQENELANPKTKSAVVQRIGTRRIICTASFTNDDHLTKATSNRGEAFFKAANEYTDYLAATPTRQTPAQYRYAAEQQAKQLKDKAEASKQKQKDLRNSKKKPPLSPEEKQALAEKYKAQNQQNGEMGTPKKGKLKGSNTHNPLMQSNGSTRNSPANKKPDANTNGITKSTNRLADSTSSLSLTDSNQSLTDSNNSLRNSLSDSNGSLLNSNSNNHLNQSNIHIKKPKAANVSNIVPQVEGGGLILIDLAKVPKECIFTQYKIDAVTEIQGYQRGEGRNLRSTKENEIKEAMHSAYRNHEIHLTEITPGSIIAWLPTPQEPWTTKVTLPRYYYGDDTKNAQLLTIDVINTIEERDSATSYVAFIKPGVGDDNNSIAAQSTKGTEDEQKLSITQGFGLFDQISDDREVILDIASQPDKLKEKDKEKNDEKVDNIKSKIP